MTTDQPILIAERGTGADVPKEELPLKNPNPFLYSEQRDKSVLQKKHPCGIKESPWVPARVPVWPSERVDTLRATTLEKLKKYVPTRLEFTFPHPKADHEYIDLWYIILFNEIFDRSQSFVERMIIQKEPWHFDNVPKKSPWLEFEPDDNISKLVQLVDEIARADPDCGGWDLLIHDDRERRRILVGVITQVLNATIFEQILFGADTETEEILKVMDDRFLGEDGYKRKARHARTVREFQGEDDILTPNFWPEVDRITYQLFEILFQLTTNREKDTENFTSEPLTANYQMLYDLVAVAGYTAVCMAYSTSIFRVEFARPGELVSLEQQQFDEDVYKRSKEQGAKVDEANTKDAVDDEGKAVKLTPDQTKGYRMAKVKIVMWPNIARYTPIDKPKDGYIAHYGDRIATLTKSKVCYYAGRTDKDSEKEEGLTLEEHLKKKHKDAVKTAGKTMEEKELRKFKLRWAKFFEDNEERKANMWADI